MTFLKSTLVIAAAAVAFSASAASARVTSGDCTKMSTKVAQAIEATSDTTQVKSARAEQTKGAYWCDLGSYQKGLDHYNLALAAVGQK